MTRDIGPERDERELRALFDRTAETPDRVQLVKLEARARDVPSAARRHGRARVWGAVFAIAAGALAVFAARGIFEHAGAGPTAPTTTVASTASATESALAQNKAPTAKNRAPDEVLTPEEAESLVAASDGEGELETEEGAELGAIGEDTGAEDPLAVLDAPQDDEVDQWMSATDAYLGGG